MKKQKIGVVAGNFDVIHPGYIHLFNECKKHCDVLLVFLHEDPSLERESKLKPVLTIDERTLILSSLQQVDEIISYRTESEFLTLLKDQEIDIRFLGNEYQGKEFTGKELDIPIHYVDRTFHGWSTTKYKNLLVDEGRRAEILEVIRKKHDEDQLLFKLQGQQL